MSVSVSAFGCLTIDIAAMVRNWQSLKAALNPGAECAAVVKANAYGMGVAEAAPALAEAGCRTFFVASLAEALELLGLLPAAARIFVLAGCMPGEEHTFIEQNIRPVIISADMLARWLSACRAHSGATSDGDCPPAALKIDTGMNRYGIRADDVQRLGDELYGCRFELVMSHLACADEPEHPLNQLQKQRFAQLASLLKKRLPHAVFSLANSAGIALGSEFHFDLVRPGVALYGGQLPSEEIPILPVARLELPVVAVHLARQGEGIGYGATFICECDKKLITVSGGYADGVLRSLSGNGKGFIEGFAIPLVGRVSMDSLVFDVSGLPENVRVEEGTLVEILGPHQGVDELAQQAGTISYEIMTSFGGRYRRVYHV